MSKTSRNGSRQSPKSELLALASKADETLELVRKLSEHVLRRDPAPVLNRRGELRTIQCTQEEFERLPGMVKRAEFLAWTGLNKDDLLAEVRAGRIQVFKPDENGYALYYKHEIARLTGFKM